MSDDAGTRKTRAIMFSDIKGYSKMMGENEARAIALLAEHDRTVTPIVERHGGQVLKHIGDSVMASYESAADAVQASIEIQQALIKRNGGVAENERITVRIGVHVGDVVMKDGDVFGDGVNIAARLEPQAEPGGIAISQTVHDMIRANPELRTEAMGTRELKNISAPMQLFRVLFDGAPKAATPSIENKLERLERAAIQPQVVIDVSKLSRKERRRLEDEEHERNAHPVEGWVYLAIGAAIAGAALLNLHDMWWLLFVAMGPAQHGARILGRQKQKAAGELPPQRVLVDGEKNPEALAPKQPAAEPAADASEKAKVDALCDKLRADLASAPAITREVIRNPEKTVEGLRKSCHALLQRTAQLRSFCDDGERKRLDAERATLATRVANESDSVARERLQGALGSLDDQLRQRDDLGRQANRLDAEYTRLSYALQNLHTQVIRVKSVDLSSETQQLELRTTAERLSSEMDAVAQALEDLSRPSMERVVDVAAPATTVRDGEKVRER